MTIKLGSLFDGAGGVQLTRGDCLEVMQSIPDESKERSEK